MSTTPVIPVALIRATTSEYRASIAAVTPGSSMSCGNTPNHSASSMTPGRWATPRRSIARVFAQPW